MKHTIYILILGILFFCTPLRAQEKNKPFQHLSLSLGAGTMGAGLQLTAPLHPHWALRAGFDACRWIFRSTITKANTRLPPIRPSNS